MKKIILDNGGEIITLVKVMSKNQSGLLVWVVEETGKPLSYLLSSELTQFLDQWFIS